MFKCFPRENEPHNIESISFYSSKMFISIRQWKRCPNKADIVSIKKTLTYMRRNMWTCGILCVASQVYPSKSDDSKISTRRKQWFYRPWASLKCLPSTWIAIWAEANLLDDSGAIPGSVGGVVCPVAFLILIAISDKIWTGKCTFCIYRELTS